MDGITVGASRVRREMGDVGALARSIAEVGLLHPIVVTPDGVLIAGQRRLEACRMMGWADIPATVVDLADIVRGEYAENVVRKDFAPSEMVAIAQALRPAEETAAKARQGTRTDIQHPGNFPEGRSRDKVAAYAGVSGRTLEKAEHAEPVVVRPWEQMPAAAQGRLL